MKGFLIPPSTVEVTITLKDSQREDMNKWKCTLRGEDRVVTNKNVSFCHPTLEKINETFNFDECESFVIKSY